MKDEDIIKQINEHKIYLFIKKPYFVIPLECCPICLSDNENLIAAVDSDNRMIISTKFWGTLSKAEQLFVLVHESTHYFLRHIERLKNIVRYYGNIGDTVNMIMDAKVNNYILKDFEIDHEKFITPQSLASISNLSVKNIEEESVEELVSKIKINRKETRFLSGDLKEKSINNARKIFEGRAIDKDEYKSLFKLVLTQLKAAGVTTDSLEREYEVIFGLRRTWETILTNIMRSYAGLDASYSIPNRRFDYLPGRYSIKNKTYILMDTSASISKELLSRFLGLVVDESRKSEVILLTWDATVQNCVRVSPKDLLNKKVAITGCGGTVIKPALEYIKNKVKRSDCVMVLTDGYISDLSDFETKAAAESIKCNKKFVISVDDIDLPSFKKIILKQ